MHWEERAGEVWLSLDRDEAVSAEEIIRAADEARYEDIDVEAITGVLEGGGPAVVARAPEEARPGECRVVVSGDGRLATLHVVAPGPGAPPLRTADVEAALEHAGVRVGVDHLLIGSLPLHLSGEYLVASGWDPAPGRDGQVDFAVSVERQFRPRTTRDGGVDFHSVATIPDVRTGQLLATLVDPTPGVPGRTVRGEAIPPTPGQPAVLPTGENVTLSDDGRRIYAGIDGLLEVTSGRMSVRPEFVVPGDVDFETGSVSFSGDVIVRGSVQPGFKVQAGGRVVVMGDVDDAEIEGAALVWVRGAVVGARSVVRSAGDVKVRTVHHGRIEGRRNVYVEREAHEATILAGNELILEAARNRISGGSAWAGHLVMAGEVGAVGGITTRIHVGVDPFTAELLETLATEQAEHARTLERVELATAPFLSATDGVAALDALTPERRAAVEKLIAVGASLRAQLLDVGARISALQPRDDGSRPRVVARAGLRPGAVVSIRSASYVVRTTQHRVAATLLDGQVTLTPVGNEPMPTVPSFTVRG